MKKRVLSFLLVAVMIFGILPISVVAAETAAANPYIDTSWYDSSAASGTVFEIKDVADLMGAATLSQQGVTFSGYTLKLVNNIDLNPGWDAKVKIVDGKAVLPDSPAVAFPGFATFSGTLDGNGKTISGIYVAKKLKDDNTKDLGIIMYLKGTVKNLIINNSFVYADVKDSVSDRKIGGLVSRVQSDSSLIDTVYLDIDVWYRSYSMQRIGGAVGFTTNKCTIQNVAFVGTVGNMSPDYTVPSSSTGVYMSQLVADGNYKTDLPVLNCVGIGTCYAADGVDVSKVVRANSKAVTTGSAIGKDLPLPESVAAMNPSKYVNPLTAFNVWPDGVTADSTATYDADNKAFVKYYSKATSDQYTAYLTKLENAGYVKASDYTIGSSKYALYEKTGEYTVYVSYLEATSILGSARMRVFVDTYGTAYDTTTATGSAVCEAKVWQIDVDNSATKENGGMGYVIRLTDGTFVIIDGGYASDANAKSIYNVLSSNNVLGGNPTVTAWFITHAHADHYGVLTNFAANYGSKVNVKGFYYNFPGSAVAGTENADVVTLNNMRDAEMAMNLFAGAIKYRKVHSGMSFNFAGATATVFGTHEDVNQSYNENLSTTNNTFKDGNDTSMVVKFTIGSQSIMFLADARTGMSKNLEHSFKSSDLKADIVQFAHHGYTGCRQELYEMIGASVVLWPMDVVSGDMKSNPFKTYYNQDFDANTYVRTSRNVKEVIPAFETVCLSMPYVANTYSGAGNKVVDVDKAYKNKLVVLNTPTGPDTSWYIESADTYYLYDANDLLGFAQLGDSNNFAGKTIVLMNNIDLNPGWSAEVNTVNGKIVFPSEPENVWPTLGTFKGTLDGNGYTVSGIYAYLSLNNKAPNSASGWSAVIDTLDGGTVKNLSIKNSISIATNTASSGTSNLGISGLVGAIKNNAKLQNIYSEMEVWYIFHEQCSLGGFVGAAQGPYTAENLVFAGRIGNTDTNMTANFATASNKQMRLGQIVANQNWKTGSTLKNSLAIGTFYSGNYATSTTYGGQNDGSDKLVKTNCLTAKQNADYLTTNTEFADAGWKYSETLGTILPANVCDMIEGTYKHAEPDTSSGFAAADENTVYIYTAEQLLALSGDYAGKTIKLMNNIDLNPGWSAEVKVVDGVAVFPEQPANVWTTLSTLKGVFDGNGYTISGMYVNRSFSATSAGGYGMVVNTLDGGTIKNLAITNSFFTATNTAGWGTLNVGVGGLVGSVNTGARMENLYLDYEFWYVFPYHQSVGGVLGYVPDNNLYSMENIVFAGNIGYANKSLEADFTASNPYYIGQFVGNHSWKTATGANLLCAGTIYGSNYKTSGTYVATNSKLTVTNGLISKQPASYFDDNPAYAEAGWVYNETIGSIVPADVGAIIDGTYTINLTPEIFYQVTDVVDGKYSIRFVAGLNNLALYNEVGFKITLKVGENTYALPIEVTTDKMAYTSLIADGETIGADQVGDGYAYLYACTIAGVTATDNITIEISAVNVDGKDTTFIGEAVTYTFFYGTGHAVAR